MNEKTAMLQKFLLSPMFKSIFILSFVLCFAGFNASGQLPAAGIPLSARSHSVSVDVKVVSSGGATSVGKNTKDEHGRFTGNGGQGLSTTTYENKVSQIHQTVLAIAVRNFSTVPDEVQLEWYFFGAQVGSSKYFVFDSGTRKLPLAAGETQAINAASKEAETTTVQQMTTASGYNPLYSTERLGTSLKGWMVRLVADGKVVQVRASDLKYEEIGKDDSKLQTLKQPQHRRK